MFLFKKNSVTLVENNTFAFLLLRYVSVEKRKRREERVSAVGLAEETQTLVKVPSNSAKPREVVGAHADRSAFKAEPRCVLEVEEAAEIGHAVKRVFVKERHLLTGELRRSQFRW